MRRLQPTEPEDRSEHWVDVESLLSPGFLSQTVVLNGISVCIRNPNESDLWMLKQLYPNASSWVEYSDYLLSRCIWCVDGVVILGDDDAQREVYKFIEANVSVTLFQILFYCLLGLFLRMRRAERDIYAYIYESSSRLSWGGLPPGEHIGSSHGSVNGVSSLGINLVQRVWYAYNRAEDQRIEEMSQWGHTKNIMATQAPKGVKKLDDKDRQNLEKMKNDRQRVMDDFYYRSIGVLDSTNTPADKEAQANSEKIHFANSAEELADEMHRWVTGEDDAHDTIVREYKEGIRRRMSDERKAREERLRKLHEEQEIAARTFGYDSAKPRIVGYSLDEVQKMMEERGININAPGARTIGYEPSRRERAFDRWVEANPDSGNLKSVDGKLEVVEEQPQQNRTLQEQVAQRRPVVEEDR